MTSPHELCIQRPNWYPSSEAEYRQAISENRATKPTLDSEMFFSHIRDGEMTFEDYCTNKERFDQTSDGAYSDDFPELMCSDEGAEFRENTKYDQRTSLHIGNFNEEGDSRDDDEHRVLIGIRNCDTVGVYFEWDTKGSYWGDSHISIEHIGLHYFDFKGTSLPVNHPRYGKPSIYCQPAHLKKFWGSDPTTQHTPNNGPRNGCLFTVYDEHNYWIYEEEVALVGISIDFRNWAYKSTAHTRCFNIYNMMPYVYRPDGSNALLVCPGYHGPMQNWLQDGSKPAYNMCFANHGEKTEVIPQSVWDENPHWGDDHLSTADS